MSETTLVCAATVREMDACLAGRGLRFESLPEHGELAWARTWSDGGRAYVLAVTGVGIPLTMARLLPLAAGCAPRLILNVGIAGAYVGSGLGLGDVVVGESECFGDLGMETPGPEIFLPLATMPWADEVYRTPFPLETAPLLTAPLLTAPSPTAPQVRTGRGCTVNACTGRAETGLLRRKLFSADFESMEGAAVALVARMLGLPAGELRAVSNFASTRDMRPENIDTALRNLSVYMAGWFGRPT